MNYYIIIEMKRFGYSFEEHGWICEKNITTKKLFKKQKKDYVGK